MHYKNAYRGTAATRFSFTVDINIMVLRCYQFHAFVRTTVAYVMAITCTVMTIPIDLHTELVHFGRGISNSMDLLSEINYLNLNKSKTTTHGTPIRRDGGRIKNKKLLTNERKLKKNTEFKSSVGLQIIKACSHSSNKRRFT